MARIKLSSLAGLCRRVAITLRSGIGARRCWRMEADRASGRLGQVLRSIRDATATGGTTADAVHQADDFFPSLFCEMVTLGEESGTLAEVFAHLADHYEHRLKMRRNFLAAIAWPVIQLSAAVVIVGFLIWFFGAIGGKGLDGKPIDVLGLGLTGTAGLLAYIAAVSSVVIVGGSLTWLIVRGGVWSGPLQRASLAVPLVGRVVRLIALSRFAWTLGIALGAGMNILRAISLSLRSTQNARYSSLEGKVQGEIESGGDLTDALTSCRAFPDDLLDTVSIGERSGTLSESLLQLAELYQQRARAGMAILATVGGFAVWAMVAAFIVFLIFRLFYMFYLKPIYDLLEP